jgi:hypothetical protein
MIRWDECTSVIRGSVMDAFIHFFTSIHADEYLALLTMHYGWGE